MQPYLGPPWTDSHQIWAVDVFHHAAPKHGIQNTEMQKKKNFFVTSSLLYSIDVTSYRNFAHQPAFWLHLLYLPAHICPQQENGMHVSTPGGGGLHKYDLGRDMPLRLKK